MNPQNQQPTSSHEGQNTKKRVEKNDWLNDSMLVFAKFSSWVAGPVFLGIFIGKVLENRFPSNGQLIFLFCLGTAFLISIAGLVMEANKEYKKILDKDKSISTDNKIDKVE